MSIQITYNDPEDQKAYDAKVAWLTTKEKEIVDKKILKIADINLELSVGDILSINSRKYVVTYICPWDKSIGLELLEI